MVEDLLHVYAMNLDYARRLVADIPDEKMAVQPAPGMNHAAWILGHLARTCDFLLSQFDEPGLLPPAWADLYGRDTKPQPEREKYASKAELIAALERGHARVAEVLRSVDPKRLDEPPPLERVRVRLPTRRKMLVYMLVAHEQMHLGQLSAWRRAQGYPAVG